MRWLRWAPLAASGLLSTVSTTFSSLSLPPPPRTDAILLIKISPLTTTRGGGWIARGENGFGAYRVRQYIARWVHVFKPEGMLSTDILPFGKFLLKVDSRAKCIGTLPQRYRRGILYSPLIWVVPYSGLLASFVNKLNSPCEFNIVNDKPLRN